MGVPPRDLHQRSSTPLLARSVQSWRGYRACRRGKVVVEQWAGYIKPEDGPQVISGGLLCHFYHSYFFSLQRYEDKPVRSLWMRLDSRTDCSAHSATPTFSASSAKKEDETVHSLWMRRDSQTGFGHQCHCAMTGEALPHRASNRCMFYIMTRDGMMVGVQ